VRRWGRSVTEDATAKLLVPDELWAIVEPLLPRHVPSPRAGTRERLIACA
jgi:hypothetical protein